MKTSQKPENFEELEKNLGFSFRNRNLLKTAFIHRSYLNEHRSFKGSSNERLEFLGDSVLSLIVSRHLFEQLPGSSEGELTTLRASLVRTETLALLARDLALGNFLLLSRGEEESGGRNNHSILANTFEALLGAIYLDQGLSQVESFLKKVILSKWRTLTKSAVPDNKSKLQEALQRQYHESPAYRLLSSWGPDHARKFEIGVFLGEKLLGKGTGKNKQQAAQNAANDALSRLKRGSLG